MALPEVFANNPATVVLSGGTDAPASGTVQTWTVGSSAGFPAASTGGAQFHAADPARAELIAVTNVSGTTWTVTRGAEGTTPVAHTAGFTVQQVVTAGALGSFAQLLRPSGDTTGATDSAAITASLAAYGCAVLGGGQFWAHDLVIDTGQWIGGQGEEATKLSLAVGHTRLLSTRNFASLTKTGTATVGVPYNFGWRNLTLDGNGANQTAQLAAPSAPTIGNAGTPGSTSYTYRVTWTNALGETVGSAAATTSTGAATLNGTNYNTVTRPSAPSGATGWNVYVGGRGQETLCNAAPVAVATTVYNDQGTRQGGPWNLLPRSNTTADTLIAVYGYGWQAYQFTIHNAAGLGLWTEWAAGAQSDPVLTDQMEALLGIFKIHNCAGGAWVCAGTHDIQASNFILAQNGSGAGYATLTVPIDGTVNGGSLRQYHIWGGGYDYGVYMGAAGLDFEGQAEGGLLAQVFCNASLNRIRGKLFDGGINTTTTVGLVLGQGVNNTFADLKVEGCGGGVMDVTGFGGDSVLRIFATYYGSMTVPSPLYVGTLDGNSVLDLHVINNAGATVAGSGLTREAATLGSLSVSGAITAGSVTDNGIDLGAGLADPLSIGFASTSDPRALPGSSTTFFAGGFAYFAAFIGYGQTTSTLRIDIDNSSGNISVGTYGNNGSTGTARLPSARKSTTGAIPCPAAGVATVTLTGSVTIARGDYGAISCDNTSATFGRTVPNSSNISLGVLANAGSSHPLPATASASNGGALGPWVATS